MDPRTDQELLDAAGRGAEGAFDALYARHGARTYRQALRVAGQAQDAADATQEAFLHVLDRAGELRLSGQLSSYLYPVVSRLARRARERARRHASDEEVLRAAAGSDGGTYAGGATELAAALVGLPEAQREALLLRFVDGLSVAETALALDVPPGTVKSRVHQAIAALRADPRTAGRFGLDPEDFSADR